MTITSDNRNTIAAASTSSLALVLAGTNTLYRIKLDESGPTPVAPSSVLISTQGTGPGQLSLVGKGAFGPGPDPLFYLLDQANGANRVQAFDFKDDDTLTEAQRFKGSFPVLNTLSLSAGMAISPTGHMYIADGLGGFSEYDLLGTHLGDFTFSGSPTPDTNGFIDPNTGVPQTGAPFLDLDENGYIYVYTPETGLHQYFDASGAALPQPAGYWKNQKTWPVTSLTLGGKVYSMTELQALLKLPREGDASIILAFQLIPAKLNMANGVVAPQRVTDAIANVDALLAQYIGKLAFRVKPSTAAGKVMTTTATTLETFNNGK